MRVSIAALTVALALLTGCSDGLAVGTCTDQTSYDYNWNDDMLCKRPNGKTFETNYAGASAFESKHAR